MELISSLNEPPSLLLPPRRMQSRGKCGTGENLPQSSRQEGGRGEQVAEKTVGGVEAGSGAGGKDALSLAGDAAACGSLGVLPDDGAKGWGGGGCADPAPQQ